MMNIHKELPLSFPGCPPSPDPSPPFTQISRHYLVEHGPPANLRSDNGPEFTAKVVREWLERVEVKTLYIEPGSPWENGYNESFNGTLGEEVLKREIFYSLEEAKMLIEQWRREYNTIRPHSSLRYRPPAPEALRPDPFFLNLPKLNGPHPRLQEALGLTQ